MIEGIYADFSPNFFNVLLGVDFSTCMDKLWDIKDFIKKSIVANSLLSKHSVFLGEFYKGRT